MWKVCLLTCQGCWGKLSVPDFWDLSLQGRSQGQFSKVAICGKKKRNQTGELHPVTWWGSTRQHDHCGWPAGVRAKGGLIWEQRMAYLKIQLRMVSRMLFYKMCILWLWALDLSLHFLIESVGCVHTDTSMPFLIFTIISYSFHYFFLYFL